MSFAIVVDLLKQVLTWKVLYASNDVGQTWITHFDGMHGTAFTADTR